MIRDKRSKQNPSKSPFKEIFVRNPWPPIINDKRSLRDVLPYYRSEFLTGVNRPLDHNDKDGGDRRVLARQGE